VVGSHVEMQGDVAVRAQAGQERVSGVAAGDLHALSLEVQLIPARPAAQLEDPT
jgi:hypothetical protein